MVLNFWYKRLDGGLKTGLPIEPRRGFCLPFLLKLIEQSP